MAVEGSRKRGEEEKVMCGIEVCGELEREAIEMEEMKGVQGEEERKQKKQLIKVKNIVFNLYKQQIGPSIVKEIQ